MQKYLLLSLLFSHSLIFTSGKGNRHASLDRICKKWVPNSCNVHPDEKAENSGVVIIREKPQENAPKSDREKIILERKKAEEAAREKNIPNIACLKDFPALKS